jgi:hypothetical protein
MQLLELTFLQLHTIALNVNSNPTFAHVLGECAEQALKDYELDSIFHAKGTTLALVNEDKTLVPLLNRIGAGKMAQLNATMSLLEIANIIGSASRLTKVDALLTTLTQRSNEANEALVASKIIPEVDYVALRKNFRREITRQHFIIMDATGDQPVFLHHDGSFQPDIHQAPIYANDLPNDDIFKIFADNIATLQITQIVGKALWQHLADNVVSNIDVDGTLLSKEQGWSQVKVQLGLTRETLTQDQYVKLKLSFTPAITSEYSKYGGCLLVDKKTSRLFFCGENNGKTYYQRWIDKPDGTGFWDLFEWRMSGLDGLDLSVLDDYCEDDEEFA